MGLNPASAHAGFLSDFCERLLVGENPRDVRESKREARKSPPRIKKSSHASSVLITTANSESDFTWTSHYRPPGFMQNTSVGAFQRLPKGANITVLTPALRFVADKSIMQVLPRAGVFLDRIKNQLMVLNGEYERWLLKKSYQYSNAPEVLHVRAFDKNGQVIAFATGVGVGNQNSISIETTQNVIDSLPQVRDIFLLEIAHTHPIYEIEYPAPDGSGSKLQRISITNGDLDVLSIVSADSKPYVRMTAVLPNGYSYWQTMQNGRMVLDPLLESLPSRRPEKFVPSPEELKDSVHDGSQFPGQEFYRVQLKLAKLLFLKKVERAHKTPNTED